MKDCKKFIEQTKCLFEKYQTLDSDQVNNLRLDRCRGKFIAIRGSYFLNREFDNIIYQRLFDIVIILDLTGRFVVPIVWLPNETRPLRFEHIYQDNTCCLGLTHEVIEIWGAEQIASDFFDRILDIFLINLISFQLTRKCATAERPHGLDGTLDYYKSVFQMDVIQCKTALPYIYNKVTRHEIAKGHNVCPCGSGQILRKCHGKQINEFLNTVYLNSESKNAFLQDVSFYMRGDSR